MRVATMGVLAVLMAMACLTAVADDVLPADVKRVQVTGGFWGPKLQVYREKSIPHSWQYMAGELRALRKAGGEQVSGDLNGTWGEANLHKFLETAGYSLAMSPDPELEKRIDEVIGLLTRAQRPDGFLHAYITNSKKPQWDPAFLDGSHDGYVLGHMIQAALAHHAATGKRTFLDIACKAADEACRHFMGPNGHPGFCGHAELEMALVELYRVVPEQRYLDLSKALIEWRGHGKVPPAGPTPRAYFQDEVPLRQQKTLEGHAVRAIFFATGVADVALATGDFDYRLAANRFWDCLTMRRMNIAGGTGPRKEHEALGEDYELPNDGYYESCAACGLADFAERMFLLERRSDSADVLERTLYNAILHGMSLDGTHSYYMNPLSDKNNARYNSWVCCPPNLSRTLLKVGRYAYASGPADVWVNLFINGGARLPTKAGEVRLAVHTEYPWDGLVKLKMIQPASGEMALNLRWPGWCEKLTVSLNGERMPAARDDRGYVRIAQPWKAGDEIELAMDMPPVRIEAHPNIRDCAGKVTIMRGPIVYGLEGLDNAGDVRPELGADPQLRPEHRPDLLGGITIIRGKTAAGKDFTAIPFYAMANREKSEQEVWIRQQGMKPSDRWWEGRLYRPWKPE